MLKTEITTTRHWVKADPLPYRWTGHVLFVALTNYDWSVRCVINMHIAVAGGKKKTQDLFLPLNIFYDTMALSIRIPISIKVYFTRSCNGSEFSFACVCSFL